MIKLSKEQVIMLHSQLIAETGGTDGIRDETLLESALNAPFQTFGDTQAFPLNTAKSCQTWLRTYTKSCFC